MWRLKQGVGPATNLVEQILIARIKRERPDVNLEDVPWIGRRPEHKMTTFKQN